ncbi:MAG: serine/threonine protein kinase [Azoarcus sp.]|nr:serine/threonine protein kinase [Azoarcus sp.]
MTRHALSELAVGARLRTDFEIAEVLGGGKTSLVYRAHDRALGREAVIKEYLPSGLAYRDRQQVNVLPDKREPFREGLKRFFAEAQVMTRFAHAVLRGVWQCFKENGTAYIVMPFYSGNTVRQKVHDNLHAKDLVELFSIIFPLLEGVSVLHKERCLHLDISPDNVLVRENGMPILLDFGAVSRFGSAGEGRPLIDLTPGFAAKEQYNAADELGAWTDIYAISALAYYLVTGIIPGVAISRIVHDSLKPLTSHCTDAFPASVLDVFDRGLAIDPSERFRDITSFTLALQNAVQAVLAQSSNPAASGILSADEAVLSMPPRIRNVMDASWTLRRQLGLRAGE